MPKANFIVGVLSLPGNPYDNGFRARAGGLCRRCDAQTLYVQVYKNEIGFDE